MRLVLTNARLIDCVNPGSIPESSVTIEQGRIVEVLDGTRLPSTRDAKVVDLKGSYLLPGLWDTHVHLEWPRLTSFPVAEMTVQHCYNAVRGLIDAGIVGLRSGGTAHFIDVALKRAFDSGRMVGPRIFASGYFLTTTGGHSLASSFTKECDGPDGFARAIREQVQGGADHIKLNLTGGIMGPFWDRHWHSFYLKEELEAAFDVCHQRGYKVMAHAANPEAVNSALKLGAHSIEHGYIMDDESIRLFLEKDAWFVPTLGISHMTASQADTSWEKSYVQMANVSPSMAKRADEASDEHRKWFQRALEAGVKMAMGSDLRPPNKAVLIEMGLWVKDGATPWRTLVAATKDAADLCGVGDDLGTVEVGKLADLIVARRDPLEDIDNLRSLELVFKEGVMVADHRGKVE